MCGIAGAIIWNDVTTVDAEAIASRMVHALGHRGPDGRGVVGTRASGPASRPAHIALGHTRLAILDLSNRGAQPMKSRETPIWVTFNGEIYNFASVRIELERLGRTFASNSDTEVILQGYEEWGPAIVDRLRGMFAFAVWDGRNSELFIARDRMGIKPVYVYEGDGVLLFASEVRALLASGLVPRRLDRPMLHHYLAYQTVPPPRTLVDGVRMLGPGTSMRIDRAGRCETRTFWDLLGHADETALTVSTAEARRRTRELLTEATELHLVSDVPVGVFLSGGIDSSALVSLTREVGTTPKTFSVVLPGSVHDEAAHARTVARQFGADHTEIALADTDFRDRLPDALSAVDHPSGDGLNTFVVAQAVRRAGIKVALSGLGGDELFGGYPSFRRLRRLARYAPVWRRSPAQVRVAAAAAVRALAPESIASTKAAALLESDASLPQAFPLMREVFSRGDRAALLDVPTDGQCDPYVTLLDDAVREHPDAGAMSLVSYAEARTYMHDVLLRDTDQMSMAHALEVRVPFLDHRLVEYVMGLPDAVKQPGDVPKPLLVESLRLSLPPTAVDRPKQGFVLPFDAWMKGELREFCEHHLGPEGLEGRGLFRAAALRSLWQAFLAGDGRTTWSRPWTLVALNAWMTENAIIA